MRKLLLCILLLLVSHVIYCQRDSLVTYRKIFWVDLGLGGDFQNGVVGSFEITSQVTNHILFTGKVLSIDQTPLEETLSCPDAVNVISFSFPFSYFFRKGKWIFTVGAGPSYSEITYNPCSTLGSWGGGLGAELIGKVWYTGKATAIGISPFVNINDERIFYGLTANVAIGRFRVVK